MEYGAAHGALAMTTPGDTSMAIAAGSAGFGSWSQCEGTALVAGLKSLPAPSLTHKLYPSLPQLNTAARCSMSHLLEPGIKNWTRTL